MISKSGYYIDPKATEAVTKLIDSVPKTVGEVRRLVGLLGVYCRHIKYFSRIAKPIYELLDGKHQKVISPPINGYITRGAHSKKIWGVSYFPGPTFVVFVFDKKSQLF